MVWGLGVGDRFGVVDDGKLGVVKKDGGKGCG